MSKGKDSRVNAGRERNTKDRSDGTPAREVPRSSRSSISMTVERARAIQAHADRTGTNQDFKARAMSAADRADKEPK